MLVQVMFTRADGRVRAPDSIASITEEAGSSVHRAVRSFGNAIFLADYRAYFADVAKETPFYTTPQYNSRANTWNRRPCRSGLQWECRVP